MKNRNTIFTTILLACFGFFPTAQAVITDPEGYFPGWNTAEGQGALFSLTTGLYNTAMGGAALYLNTTGNNNTAVGLNALFRNTASSNTAMGAAALYFNTTGGYNTATGTAALRSNSTGADNTANGYHALYFNTTGLLNTANGYLALLHNTTGGPNTATGAQALQSNTSGSYNTANGYQALYANTTGQLNTANGYYALGSNTGGGSNTADGFGALGSNTTGSRNTANGYLALGSNTTGDHNTAVGATTGFYGIQAALGSNTTGDANTAIGNAALYSNTTGGSNTAVGEGALFYSRGVNNTALGADAGQGVTIASNVTCIAAPGQNVSNSCYIGHIFGQATGFGTQVFINSAHKLGTLSSSKRFKEEIRPTEQASEALFALRPVTFRYKKEIDPDGTSQFGLVAEDVEKVNPDLIVRDKEGRPYSVRYEQVNAMLLNEFLKEHKTVQELKATVALQRQDFEATTAQQQKEIQALTASLKEQAAQIQKVSAQVEVSKFAAGRIRRGGPAPRTVVSNHQLP